MEAECKYFRHAGHHCTTASGAELRAALECKLADIDARIAGLVELRAGWHAV